MDDNNTSLSPDNILLPKNGLATYEWLQDMLSIQTKGESTWR